MTICDHNDFIFCAVSFKEEYTLEYIIILGIILGISREYIGARMKIYKKIELLIQCIRTTKMCKRKKLRIKSRTFKGNMFGVL